MQTLKNTIDFISNMGMRYLWFRSVHLIKRKLGVHKRSFPINPPENIYISVASWRKETPAFFFEGKNIPELKPIINNVLAKKMKDIENGIFTFFNHLNIDLGKEDSSWVTNPQTKHTYDKKKHWSTIEDLSATAGDIKYVWEKARFSFLYDIIRYDFHHNDDKSDFVFNEIDSFIAQNPINQGPNYICSQETSLRILNWTFALYYYKDSANLSPQRFNSYMNSIYWQLHHVYKNIHFSRIAVRNNHAITETLMLYLSGLLFPFFPETKKWSKRGKKWFEQEIAYQVYNDGTFLQFSTNYHRVVVQLLTWGIKLSELHTDRFSDVVYDRAKKSLNFLDALQDPISKKLPNYGSNDGALFFKLTDDNYRVYQSQLDDLRAVLSNNVIEKNESQNWYGIHQTTTINRDTFATKSFNKGGYYIMQEKDVKTFIRCGAYKDRPAQADNLHMDVWLEGINFLWDVGTYKYNTDAKTLNYYMGTKGHNTVAVNGKNQMKKGSRFIWHYWVKEAKAHIEETATNFIFYGNINAFRHIGGRNHQRKIIKTKEKLEWKIIDSININPAIEERITMVVTDQDGNILMPKREIKTYSGYYGIEEPSIHITYESFSSLLTTKIKIK